MVIDAVFEAGVALDVGAGLAFEDDRAAIGENQPVSHERHAALTEADAVVVLADDAGSLRNE